MWPFTNRASRRNLDETRIFNASVGPSPIGPAMRYTRLAGEFDLADPQRQPLDDKLGEVCRRFAASDDATRAGMRAALNVDDVDTLVAFARRSAVFALRDRKRRHIQDGLAAMALIAPNKIDPRDYPGPLALLCSAALKNAEDLSLLLRAAAAISPPKSSQRLVSVASRPWVGADFSGTGYRLVETEGGPGLIALDTSPYNPTLPIDRYALQLAGLIEADQYHAYATCGARLPEVWLSGDDNAALAQALGVAVAGATVHGTLRRPPTPYVEHRIVILFLLELTDAAGACLEMLARAKMTRPKDFSLLAVRRNRLFCLVIARSTAAGTKSIETNQSLARFGPGIEEVLGSNANAGSDV
jgi:hypothetical protein